MSKKAALLKEAKERYEGKIINPLNADLMIDYHGEGVVLVFDEETSFIDPWGKLWMDIEGGRWKVVVYGEHGEWSEVKGEKEFSPIHYLTNLGTKINEALKVIRDCKNEAKKTFEKEKTSLPDLDKIVEEDEILTKINEDYNTLLDEIGYLDLAAIQPIVINLGDVGKTE